jgi:hypothetical protein
MEVNIGETMIRVVVSTSDKYLWALKPFSFLFCKYWSELQPVIVAGYSPPPFELPPNFEFHSIDSRPYPAQEWTNGLLKFFDHFQDEHFVWLLEDFWLRRTVNHSAVQILHDYAINHPEVYRIDLGTDRLFAKDNRFEPDYLRYGTLNLIQSRPDWEYTHSTQCGIFRRDKFIQLLQPNWSPWQFELEGAEILRAHEDWLVLGTRQIPVDYKHAVYKVDGKQVVDMEGIDPQHVEYIKSQGWLP